MLAISQLIDEEEKYIDDQFDWTKQLVALNVEHLAQLKDISLGS
jgi:hypothetical protein